MSTDEPQSARRADPDADRLYRELVYRRTQASSGGPSGGTS
jgi:hypothetical protein